MAQGIGYTGACLGPLAFGLAHEATGGWGLAGALFVGIAVTAILVGQAAGRDRKVSAAAPDLGPAPLQPSTLPASSR